VFNLDRWRELSPYLDDTLALSSDQRSKWLESIRSQNPELADRLAAALARYSVLQEEKFLESAVTVLPPPPVGLAGQSIGAYRLLSEIGQGGMGSVWLAERSDGRFTRKVAVKFLRLALLGRDGEARFKREGSILGRLSHPHIADLLDAGVTSSGQPYLVLEYVEGEPIDRYCDERKLSIEDRLRLFLEILAAVGHAHSNLIVHRDIKPSNVLVSSHHQVKLLDFGIAKLLADEEQNFLTAETSRPMTPEYAAPEQLKGSSVTTSTDIYGLGVLLYVLLTGRHPAGSGVLSPADLVKAIVDVDITVPSAVVSADRNSTEHALEHATNRGLTPDKLRRQLTGDLDTIVAKALKKDPRERYLSVGALADDIQRYLHHEPIRARPDALSYRVAKFVHRNRLAVSLAAGALFLALAGIAGILIQAHTARVQRDFALRQVKRSAALNDFHSFLLSEAAPSGKPLTVSGLLNRAERIVELQHARNDPNRVELLVSIGRQYTVQDSSANARRVLEEAYQLSHGIADVSIRSVAACALAATLARDEELDRAESLFAEGLRVLPDSPQFALERVECLQNGSEVALERNDVRKAVARAEEAQRVLRNSLFDADALELSRALDLARAYSAAGRDSEALAAFARSAKLLDALGRGETDSASVLYNTWGLKLNQMGHTLEAEKMYRRALQISRASQNDTAVSPIMLTNYARILRELNRLPEAADYAQLAYNRAKQTGHQLALDQSLLERARIYHAQHLPLRAAAMLSEVAPRLQSSLPPGHYAFAALAAEQAINALDRGDHTAALNLANRAVSIDEAAIKAGTDGNFYLPSLLLRRAGIELDSGYPDRALADASRALHQLQLTVQPGAPSTSLGRAYLQFGLALQAQEKSSEAHAAFQSAFTNLQASLGPAHPDTVRTAQLLRHATGQ